MVDSVISAFPAMTVYFVTLYRQQNGICRSYCTSPFIRRGSIVRTSAKLLEKCIERPHSIFRPRLEKKCDDYVSTVELESISL